MVLFDEIEKAHKSVFDLFLQILDEGKLHDRLGRVGDFSNALILFTSNIGSQFIVDSFNQGVIPRNNDLMDIMQNYFRPEFLGRLTEIVPFSPITEETVTRIFDIHLQGLLKLLEEQDIHLSIAPDVKRQIAMKGFNPQYGAPSGDRHHTKRVATSVIQADYFRPDPVGRYGGSPPEGWRTGVCNALIDYEN